MKTTKFQYQTRDETRKRSILKFRDYYGDEEPETYNKRRRDEGKRMHRKRTLRDEYSYIDN